MKASERRLIMIFAALTAICGGAILTQKLLTFEQAVERRERALELRQMETQALLTKAQLWQQRLAWLDASQPTMTSENQASEELLEGLLTSAAGHSLQVSKKQLHEPIAGAFRRDISVTVTVKGTLPSVFRWLHSVLSPDSFCAVPQMKIVPDSDDSSRVIATVHFSRLYTPVIARSTEEVGP